MKKTKPKATNATSNLRRFISAIVVFFFISIFATGCFRFDSTIKVSAEDRVSGTAVVALSKDVVVSKLMGLPKTSGWFKATQGVTEVPYNQGGFIGTKYTFKQVPISKFAAGKKSGNYLSIKRVGNQIRVTGLIDTRSFLKPDILVSDAVINLRRDESELRLVITLPGNISYSTGKISGNKVTFSGKVGDEISIGAVSTSQPDVINWALIGTIFAAVVLGGSAFILYFFTKKRQLPNYSA